MTTVENPKEITLREIDREIESVDRAYLDILQLCDTVARSKASVLIAGNPGSGKKLLARSIHRKSHRALKPFQVFHCKSLSKGEQENLFQSSLESAKSGTLLFVEISLLIPALQIKLAQAMQNDIDVRFIATTTQNLSLLVKQNEFREDLYYRLSVVNMRIPNLSERLGDIEQFAKGFSQKWSEVHEKPLQEFEPAAIQLLNGYSWPGNLRELESTVERAVLLAEGNLIRARDIQIQSANSTGLGFEATPSTWRPGRTLDEIERNVILEALKHHSGNRTHTAKALGISIRTLRNKLAEYRVLGIQA